MKRGRLKSGAAPPANKKRTSKPDLSIPVEQLLGASLGELKLRYAEMFRQLPPSAFGPDLLRYSIAHLIQSRVEGGLASDTERTIHAIVQQYESDPDKPIKIKRKLKVGSEFIRTWKGKTYRVVMATEGYHYAGKIYASLSEIASEITGTNWNGPRFFGLRPKA